MRSAFQTRSGIAGLIIVDGLLDPFPQLYGITEYHFAFRDEMFTNGTLDDADPDQRYRVVNNLLAPTVVMAPNEVQLWRMANFGPNTFNNLSMNGTLWHTIARDGKRLNEMTDAEFLFI